MDHPLTWSLIGGLLLAVATRLWDAWRLSRVRHFRFWGFHLLKPSNKGERKLIEWLLEDLDRLDTARFRVQRDFISALTLLVGAALVLVSASYFFSRFGVVGLLVSVLLSYFSIASLGMGLFFWHRSNLTEKLIENAEIEAGLAPDPMSFDHIYARPLLVHKDWIDRGNDPRAQREEGGS